MADTNENQDALDGLETVGAEPPRDDEEINAAFAWRGMPEFVKAPDRGPQLVLTFESEAERDAFVERLEIIIAKKTKGTWSAWWPPRPREDLASLLFDVGEFEQ
jgi:hypothetical protein